MPVKRILRRLMSDLKNLKVNGEIHQRLKIAAAEEGAGIQDFTEACIELALLERNRLRRLLADRTKSEPSRAAKK